VTVSRILAIGDVHGCSKALDVLLADVNPHGADTVVTLGDYIDRGPDSKGVLDRLLDLHGTGRLVALRGNHEVMLLAARVSWEAADMWLRCGGAAALASYGTGDHPGTFGDIPDRHWEFMESVCVNWYECATHFFVHANALPDRPLDEQPDQMLHWAVFGSRGPHSSGKVMVCGHTQQRCGWPLNLGHAVCLDTWAYGGGWLTALDVTTGQVWQANQRGERRTAHIDDFLVAPGDDP
jgi:serine/threonine protein phosphatase 1